MFLVGLETFVHNAWLLVLYYSTIYLYLTNCYMGEYFSNLSVQNNAVAETVCWISDLFQTYCTKCASLFYSAIADWFYINSLKGCIFVSKVDYKITDSPHSFRYYLVNVQCVICLVENIQNEWSTNFEEIPILTFLCLCNIFCNISELSAC